MIALIQVAAIIFVGAVAYAGVCWLIEKLKERY